MHQEEECGEGQKKDWEGQMLKKLRNYVLVWKCLSHLKEGACELELIELLKGQQQQEKMEMRGIF